MGCLSIIETWSPWHLRYLMVGLLAASCTGCQSSVEDPAVIAQRDKYLLETEPTGAVGVLEARAQMGDGSDGASPKLVVVGRVGAGHDQTWDPSQAAFVITDLTAKASEHAHGAGHDHENCPFCKGEKQEKPNVTAVAKVTDDQGAVVPIDARKLLRIKRGQLVVVEGTATVDALGNLVLAADGVYLRR